MGAGVVGVGGKRVGRVCRLRGASIKLPQNAFALVVADGGEVAFWGLEGGMAQRSCGNTHGRERSL